MEELLERLLTECRPYTARGKAADYIPELAKADPSRLGIYVIGANGKENWAGDCRQPFTIQSVIKPILLLQALLDNGEELVRSRVGMEATGKPFDAINASEQSLDSGHINPMVNMGAIVICSLIRGESYEARFQRLLELTRKLTGCPDLGIDEAVYRSEKSHGSKNRALAYLLKSYGLLEDDVEEVLDCYFRACSIQVDCRALAHIGAVLSNRGRLPNSNEQIFPAHLARMVNAILTTCGMYDGSGDFAIRVGVPAKSGVGGGIMAVVPHPHGHRHLWPRAGPEGQQRCRHPAAGKAQPRALSEHFLSILRAFSDYLRILRAFPAFSHRKKPRYRPRLLRLGK